MDTSRRSATGRCPLDILDDDILVYLFSFLSVPDILRMRQTCKRMLGISSLRTVWATACYNIKKRGYPFPETSPTTMDASELEQRARRAHELGVKWTSSSSMSPRTSLTFEANSGNPIMNLRFLPGLDGEWIVTISQGIWSVLAFWHVPHDESSKPAKMAEWTRKGAFFHTFVVNQDPDSEATVAVSVSRSQQHRSDHQIDILQLRRNVYNGLPSLKLITSIETSHLPITLGGDILAMSDRASETRILNWKTGSEAVLQDREETPLGTWQYNRCLQVVFAHESVLVVRARSVNLFPEPVLERNDKIRVYEPLATCSLGWPDAVAVTVVHPEAEEANAISNNHRPLSFLFREDSDDPWAPNTCSLTLFELAPDPTYHSIRDNPDLASSSPARSPYIFPPARKCRLSTVQGFFRCNNLFLGKFGTALWIQPRELGHAGLTGLDLHSQEAQVAGPAPAKESLMATVFPGPLYRSEEGLVSRKLLTNESRYWVSMDYDEELGMVALGNNQGDITVLRL